MIKEMAAAGMDIGLHGYAHEPSDYAIVDGRLPKWEATIAALEKCGLAKDKIRSSGYPSGKPLESEEMKDIVRDLGIKFGFTIERRVMGFEDFRKDAKTNRLTIPRYNCDTIQVMQQT